MTKILGYGEDALTLWALKTKLFKILNAFDDKTDPKNCLVFYRPSFGRSGGYGSAEFGEFDAIAASKQKIYLTESKWDNNARYNKQKIILRNEQILRHKILDWYIKNWNKDVSDKNWEILKEKLAFIEEKLIPYKDSLLAKNLGFILNSLLGNLGSKEKVVAVNVLLFLYNETCSKPPLKVNGNFKIIPVKYGTEIKSNFISL